MKFAFGQNFLIRLLYKLRLLRFFNLYGRKTINHRTYRIPVKGRIGIHNIFLWEPWMDDVIKVVTNFKDKKIVDVGANIGQTLLKIKGLAPNMEYIGFEPNPACVYYLDFLVKLNDLRNTSIIPVGISSEDSISKLTLYNDNPSDGAASIVQDFRPGNKMYGDRSVILLSAKTLSSKVNLDNISILKIDVEGAEYDVLKSFQNVIASFHPVILMEILPVYSPFFTKRLENQQLIERTMQDLNYSCVKVIKQKEKLLGFKLIKEIGIHRDQDQCDYIFIFNKDLDLFKSACNLNDFSFDL